MKLSIIVPVYNVEKYLPKCLSSLLNQGLKDEDYEILLINDGSTDRSLGLCTDYADRYANIRVFSQPNSGVGIARNKGIDNALGEYIAFVDSDDYLLENGMHEVLKPIWDRKDIDVVRYFSDYDGRNVKPIVNQIVYDAPALEMIRRGGLPAFIWTFLYRRTFLNENKIRFKNYRFSEDVLFVSTVFLHNPYVVSNQANIYRYVLREGSAINKRDREHSRICTDHNLLSYEDVMRELMTSIIREDEEALSACLSSINFKKQSTWTHMFTSDYKRSEFKLLKKRIVKNKFYPFMVWNQSPRVKIQCFLMNLSLYNFFIYRFCSGIFDYIIVPYYINRIKKKVWKTE